MGIQAMVVYDEDTTFTTCGWDSLSDTLVIDSCVSYTSSYLDSFLDFSGFSTSENSAVASFTNSNPVSGQANGVICQPGGIFSEVYSEGPGIVGAFYGEYAVAVGESKMKILKADNQNKKTTEGIEEEDM